MSTTAASLGWASIASRTPFVRNAMSAASASASSAWSSASVPLVACNFSPRRSAETRVWPSTWILTSRTRRSEAPTDAAACPDPTIRIRRPSSGPARSARLRTAAPPSDEDCIRRGHWRRILRACSRLAWKRRDSGGGRVPASWAARRATRTWPRISCSPSSGESSPAATRNRWRAASALWRTRGASAIPIDRPTVSVENSSGSTWR